MPPDLSALPSGINWEMDLGWIPLDANWKNQLQRRHVNITYQRIRI